MAYDEGLAAWTGRGFRRAAPIALYPTRWRDGPGAGGWSDRGMFHRHRDQSRAGLAHQVLMRSSAMAALAPT